MNFKFFYIIAIFIAVLMLVQGVSSESAAGLNVSGQNNTVNGTNKVIVVEDKKEISINRIDMPVDNTGFVHLSETIIIPMVDYKGELVIGEDILIPKDIKDNLKNSLLIFYELGKQKLDFELNTKDDKEVITITFPVSAKKEETQLITLEYTTYQFISTSAGVGTFKLSSLPVTPDLTIINIKFPEGSNIILNSFMDLSSVADIYPAGKSELTIRPKVDKLNMTGRYYLPSPVLPGNNEKDNEPPVVALKSPENNLTIESVNGSVTFEYSAQDAAGIKNCELIINAETRGVNDNVTAKDNEFTINLGEGRYVWTVQCRDNSSNENPAAALPRTLIISPEPDTLFKFLVRVLKSEYGISLLIAIVLILYLTFAYFRRGKKHEHAGKEPDLEDLYPTEGKKSAETGKIRKINQSIMKLMDENEQKVINILKDSGETTQANVYKITQIPKATLSNIMRKLEERNIIERRVEGKVKWVKLKDWVFE